MSSGSTLDFLPVTPQRADDLRRFAAGRRGHFSWCWCMRWRLPSGEFQRSSKEGRAADLLDRVCRDEPVGILAYADGEPVGWCSIAPRECFAALERSRILARTDEEAVWSVVCFVVDRRFRRHGLTEQLLDAATEYAFAQGAPAVEGFPVNPGSPGYTYMGTIGTFRRAGFIDVTPPNRKRVVMRRTRHR